MFGFIIVTVSLTHSLRQADRQTARVHALQSQQIVNCCKIYNYPIVFDFSSDGIKSFRFGYCSFRFPFFRLDVRLHFDFIGFIWIWAAHSGSVYMCQFVKATVSPRLECNLMINIFFFSLIVCISERSERERKRGKFETCAKAIYINSKTEFLASHERNISKIEIEIRCFKSNFNLSMWVPIHVSNVQPSYRLKCERRQFSTNEKQLRHKFNFNFLFFDFDEIVIWIRQRHHGWRRRRRQ